MIKKTFLSIFIIICFICNPYCQVESEFEKLLQQTKDLARVYPDSASNFALRLLTIAKRSNSNYQLAEAFNTMGLVMLVNGKVEESSKYLDTAIMLSQKSKEYKILAEAYGNKGSNYQNQTDHVNAVIYLTKAYELAKSINIKSEISHSLRSLAKIQAMQGKYDKELEYLNKLKNDIPHYDNSRDEGLLYHSLGEHYANVGESKLCNQNFEKAFQIFQKANIKYSQAWTESIWAIQYAGSDLNKTLSMMLSAQTIFDSIAPYSVFSGNNIGNIGEVYRMFATNDSLINTFAVKGLKKDKKALLKSSETYLLRQVSIANNIKSDFDLMNAKGNLAILYSNMGNYKAAYDYYSSYHGLSEKIFSQKNKNKLAKLEAEKELIMLEGESKRKSLYNYFLIFIVGSILIFAALLYKNTKYNQKIQQLRITELENEKQLSTVDALLQGQQEERSRIAKDLHDGLGGMLNGVKLSINNMKESLVMSHDDVVVFEKSLNQLDTTIAELRKISHNLMPDALVRLGLNDAIRDYCNCVVSGDPKISYQQMGDERLLSNTANLYIYRIIQELIGNALKHAKPNNINVQLSYLNHKILLSVDDDGRGFDFKLSSNAGMGLKNIRNRVDYFKGTIDVKSSVSEGTSTNIELLV